MDPDDPLMQAEIERDERAFRLAHTDSPPTDDGLTLDDVSLAVLRGEVPTRYPVIVAT